MIQSTATDARRQAINRALDRATTQAGLGNLPTLVHSSFDGAAIHETWHVASRTTDGVLYTVHLTRTDLAVTTTCNCPAGELDRTCWHRASARLASLDVINSHNQAGLRIRPRALATAR